nr:MAG TPA: hypothetical protein [Caudoviricetes sp.]
MCAASASAARFFSRSLSKPCLYCAIIFSNSPPFMPASFNFLLISLCFMSHKLAWSPIFS